MLQLKPHVSELSVWYQPGHPFRCDIRHFRRSASTQDFWVLRITSEASRIALFFYDETQLQLWRQLIAETQIGETE